MLKCVKSGRPLIHIMRVWSILGPHFMEAACHKDRGISKKAVACIHDSMAALLNDQFELPHFHFNEALFKPFENLLCLELCDSDVQDQVRTLICYDYFFQHILLSCEVCICSIFNILSSIFGQHMSAFINKSMHHCRIDKRQFCSKQNKMDEKF